MNYEDEDKIVNVPLTKSQCKNICNFIESYMFEIIRKDDEIDNINWLVDMMEAYKKLKEALQNERQ